ncbi:MAG: Mur ligase domain-containing protein [Candidatus Paceibacterota bacterium]|jgi:UDP-N-acetylmuramate--alanine ligase
MKKAYFVGIGGIGMSALAQMMFEQGIEVTGSDRAVSPVTELLERKGITVAVGQEAEHVPADAEMVVYSDAVPEDNPERTRARELGIPELSYFKMLGQVSLGKRTVAVAGTHGKTTTTGMLARILQDAGASPTVIVGSILKDFGSNYVHGNSDLFLVEACEYRDHLLELSPEILVLTNIEWDHTDWFPSLQVVQATFRRAIEHVPVSGALITDPSHPNIAPLLTAAKCTVIDYTREPAYELHTPGEFNQMNAHAAAAAARVVLARTTPGVENYVLTPGVDGLTEQIAKSLAAFQGTWRRFEYKGKTKNGADVYDDYAHHPTAIRATLAALRERILLAHKETPRLREARKARKETPRSEESPYDEVTPYGSRKVSPRLYVAFHPHLYSRTRDLLDEFATAFGDADKVFIAPIFAARETDDGSISSEMLAERIRATGVDATALGSFDAIEKALGEAGPGDTIITMGAGDIYKVADSLVKH